MFRRIKNMILATGDTVRFQTSLQRMFDKLPQPFQIIQGEAIDIVHWKSWPVDGVSYYLTKGLAGVRIRNECKDCDIYVRQEIGIGIRSTEEGFDASRFLKALAEEAIELNRGFGNRLAYDYHYGPYFVGAPHSLAGFYCVENAWISATAVVDSCLPPIRIVDLFPITIGELQEERSDPDLFWKRIAERDVDLMNFRR